MAQRLRSVSSVFRQVRFMSQSGQWGEGSGKGGGAGGSIREAGGSFGKMEAAREEEYFRKLQAKQMEKLKDSIHDDIEFHAKQIKIHQQQEQLKKMKGLLEEEVKYHEQSIRMHQDAINRHKRKIGDLKDQGDDSD